MLDTTKHSHGLSSKVKLISLISNIVLNAARCAQVYHRRGFSKRMADEGSLRPLFVAVIFDAAGQLPPLSHLADLADSCAPTPIHLACPIQHQKVLFLEVRACAERGSALSGLSMGELEATTNLTGDGLVNGISEPVWLDEQDAPPSSPPSPPSPPRMPPSYLHCQPANQLSGPLGWQQSSAFCPSPPPSPPQMAALARSSDQIVGGLRGGVVIAGEDEEGEEGEEKDAEEAECQVPTVAHREDVIDEVLFAQVEARQPSEKHIVGSLAARAPEPEAVVTQHLIDLQRGAEKSLLSSIQVNTAHVRNSLDATAQSIATCKASLQQSRCCVEGARRNMAALAQSLHQLRHGSSMEHLWTEGFEPST